MKHIEILINNKKKKVPLKEKNKPISNDWSARNLVINNEEDLYIVKKNEEGKILHKKVVDNRYSDLKQFFTNILGKNCYTIEAYNFIELFKTNNISIVSKFLDVHYYTLRSYLKEYLGKGLYKETLMRRLEQLSDVERYRVIEFIHTTLIKHKHDVNSYLDITYIKANRMLERIHKFYPIIEYDNVRRLMKFIYNKIKEYNYSFKSEAFLGLCIALVHNKLKEYNKNNYLKLSEIQEICNITTVTIRKLGNDLNIYKNNENLAKLSKIIE